MAYTKMARLASAAGVAALTLGSAVMVASPATAATAKLRYACTAEITGVGPITVPVDVVLGTDAPATVPPAITTPVLNGTADVTVQGELMPGKTYAQVFRDLADTVEGTASVGTTLDGAAMTSNFTVAKQALSTTGDLTIKAAGPLYSVATGAAGAVHKIAADNFTVKIKMSKGGAPSGVPEIELKCAKPATGDLTASTITVDAAAPIPVPTVVDTTTKVSAKFKKGVITAKVAVTGATDGKAKVTVKGPKKFKKTLNATIKGGKATVKIKKIKVKGKYKIKVALAATATSKASTGKVTVTVK